MDFFDILNMIGGLALFLFGMSIMGQSLEKRAGNGLKSLLDRLTGNKFGGVVTGMGVTVLTQSSSATTVMIVGFVNSGIITLSQAINIIIGSNVGTTATAWILSLSGISSENFFLSLLKPSSFTPVLAFVGIILYMFVKDEKKKDLGTILLGFATLMAGMHSMSSAASGLTELPGFRNLLTVFDNPVLGMLVGTLITAAIQSSAASIGILQALASTGQVSNAAAIPIVMGQNIGTCITALISSVGATKNGKRAAFAHLIFNAFGTLVWLTVFIVIKKLFNIVFLSYPVTLYGIAAIHTVFNVLTMIIALPLTGMLEKLVKILIPESENEESFMEFDERLFKTPPLAIEQCRIMTVDMAFCAIEAIKNALSCIFEYDEKAAEIVREDEDKTDHYEDALGTYLVTISGLQISKEDSARAGTLLKLIGDFERIADHAVNILESADELRRKNIDFSEKGDAELKVITSAVNDIIDKVQVAFINEDLETASTVEPLEQVIDDLKDELRINHVLRLQRKECSIDAGFVWSDLLTNFERTSDHCSNIAGTIIDMHEYKMNLHESLNAYNHSTEFEKIYSEYKEKYAI
ncbi:MAG: Na/Pi cotransporter family protein [Clostridia bacterium]|nr:Na/Pi cotransporter family protein [Clostridia bacterium]